MIGTMVGTGHYIVSVFIDLKKAFDTVDQSILCEKSRHDGRSGQPAAGEPQAALCLSSCGSLPVFMRLFACLHAALALLLKSVFLIYVNFT